MQQRQNNQILTFIIKTNTTLIRKLNSLGMMQSANAMVQQEFASPTASIDIAFRDILYQVSIKKKEEEDGSSTQQTQTKTILHGVSGIFKGGELTAIMGSSGAGKTTLLNILAGRITHFKGELFANNKPYNFQIFGDFANYVMQNDVLMQTLTVRQTLQFGARLRIKDEETIQRRLETLTKKLKLEKCLDVVVGGPILKGISGGQKKRTSIGFELMSDPQVVALDQPTSGMDSLTSYIIVNELKDLAKAGKTIFLTIHQPNDQIFDLFDKLILLVEGKIVYQGKSCESVDYFDNKFGLVCPTYANPADFLIQILHHEDKNNVARYPEYFRVYKEQIAKKVDLEIENRQQAQLTVRVVETTKLSNMKVLLHRDYLNLVRNPMILKARIFQTIFMAIFTGGLYFNAGRYDYTDRLRWNTIIGFLFFSLIQIFFESMMPVSIVFPSERLVFLKQQNSKLYGVLPYFISRNLVEIPYLFLCPLIYTLIIYWMIGLANTAQQFFIMYLTYFLLTFTGSSVGLLAGSILIDEKSINAVVPIFALPLILFSGFFKNSGNIPDWIGWIQYISPFKYSFIGIASNEVKYKDSLISELNFDLDMWPAIIVVLALGVGMRIISFFFLWLKKSRLE